MKIRIGESMARAAAIMVMLAPFARAQSNQELLDEIRAMRQEVRSLRQEVFTLREQLVTSGAARPVAAASEQSIPGNDPGPGGPRGTGGNAPFLTISAEAGLFAHPPGLPFVYTAEARYFQPFGRDLTRFGFLAADRYSSYPARQENQLDIGGVVRLMPALQTGLVFSAKRAELDALRQGVTLGQTTVLLDWIFPQRSIEAKDGSTAPPPAQAAMSPGRFGGKLGFFASANFLSDRPASSPLVQLSSPDLTVRAPQQFGADAQLSWTHLDTLENLVLDLNYAYLRQSGAHTNIHDFYTQTPFAALANAHAGSVRVTAPFSPAVAAVLEAGWNQTQIRPDRTTFEMLFGFRFGHWPSPAQFRGQRRATPMEAPPIRYELYGAGSRP